MGPRSPKQLGLPVSVILSLPLPVFFSLIPWNIEAPCDHLSARVSKTWTGRHSASSLPQETGKAPVASLNRANFLSQSVIGFLCKPRNISLFLSSTFLSTIFFPYLTLNNPQMPFFLQVPLDPAGAGPRHTWAFNFIGSKDAERLPIQVLETRADKWTQGVSMLQGISLKKKVREKKREKRKTRGGQASSSEAPCFYF